MPIIATRASAAYGAGFAAITAPAYLGPFGAYDSLATTTLSATTASVTFTGIPAGYKHLQIRAISKNSAGTSGYDYVHANFNTDTSASYSLINTYGSGTSVGVVGGQGGLAYARVGICAQNGTTSIFGVSVIDILDYASSTKHKTVRSLAGNEANGNNTDGVIYQYGASWHNTSPITSITLAPANLSFVALSSFALYGVK
jgi:hypothetical protein